MTGVTLDIDASEARNVGAIASNNLFQAAIERVVQWLIN